MGIGNFIKGLFGLKNSLFPLYHQQEEVYLEVLSALAEAIEAKDHTTKGHSDRMVKYVIFIGKRLGMSNDELKNMEMSAILHDIGKIGIDKSVLLKPGKLTDEEYETIKKHPIIGANIIGRVRFLKGAEEFVRYHHERWDGKGYPEGLKSERIPLGARILGVVDAFDAMVSERPYKRPMTLDDAKIELKKNSGTQFDPQVVDIFLQYEFGK